jgi:hypothetical protein
MAEQVPRGRLSAGGARALAEVAADAVRDYYRPAMDALALHEAPPRPSASSTPPTSSSPRPSRGRWRDPASRRAPRRRCCSTPPRPCASPRAAAAGHAASAAEILRRMGETRRRGVAAARPTTPRGGAPASEIRKGRPLAAPRTIPSPSHTVSARDTRDSRPHNSRTCRTAGVTPRTRPHRSTRPPRREAGRGAGLPPRRISIDDFMKVDLRVAKVLEAERCRSRRSSSSCRSTSAPSSGRSSPASPRPTSPSARRPDDRDRGQPQAGQADGHRVERHGARGEPRRRQARLLVGSTTRPARLVPRYALRRGR